VEKVKLTELRKNSSRSDAERLERLERKGLIRRGNGKSQRWLVGRRAIKVPGSVLQDLLEERRNGR
jgi:LexA DNA binding domain-containing protein